VGGFTLILTYIFLYLQLHISFYSSLSFKIIFCVEGEFTFDVKKIFKGIVKKIMNLVYSRGLSGFDEGRMLSIREIEVAVGNI